MKISRKPKNRLLRPQLLLGLALLSSCSPEADDHDHEDDSHGAHAVEDDAHAAEDDPHASHEEGHLALSAEQLASTGIQIATVGPGEVTDVLTLAASVQPNLDAVAHVNPRVPGIVRSIHKHLGESVEAGELLCEVESVELGTAISDYLRSKALVAAAEATLAREEDLFTKRVETTERVLQGAIDVNRTLLDREKELQESAISTLRPVLEAERELRTAELAKDQELTDLKAQRDARLLALEIDLTNDRVELTAAKNRLRSLGIAEAALAGLDETSPLLEGRYEIRASLSGVVVGRHITAGEHVDSNTRLYEIENLSQVWVIASAYEQDLRNLAVGQEAHVRLDAFPEESFPGEVALIDFRVAPESRSIGVRIDLANRQVRSWGEEYPIRPGMFGSVDVVTSRRRAAVVVPEAALVHEGPDDFVFVQEEPGEFERRKVAVRHGSDQIVEVVSGVQPGDEVVVEGAFALKSMARSEELGGGHSH